MIFIYRLLINIIFIISPIIIILRLIKKKENIYRFKEKYCFFSEKRRAGKLIWFHGASVGELQSIMPLIQRLEKDHRIKQILVTSNTLSSSKIIKKNNFKKVTHQFFPIDTKILTKSFLNYWQPEAVFFIDSEIWPNMLYNIKKYKIPLALINGRITKKTFKKWIKIPKFSQEIFKKFDFCLASSNESKNLLKKLGAKNIIFYGNLKFSQIHNENTFLENNIEKLIKNKIVWCASSTHETEEKICGIIHNNLKKKYKNLLTIIIPRHINRTEAIKNELKRLNLKVFIENSNLKLENNIDIFIVNSYGKTRSFYSSCKNVFLGGSLIKHGGQNPLEAARFGCNILHGPNVHNFKEIYKFLENLKISKKINNLNQMTKALERLMQLKHKTLNNKKKLELIGKKVLDSTYHRINILINDKY